MFVGMSLMIKMVKGKPATFLVETVDAKPPVTNGNLENIELPEETGGFQPYEHSAEQTYVPYAEQTYAPYAEQTYAPYTEQTYAPYTDQNAYADPNAYTKEPKVYIY